MDSGLSGVVDALPGLIWTARADGYTDFINRRWCEYTGLTIDEAAGWGWQTVVHPEDRPALIEFWRSIVASGESGEFEARMRRFDGEYHWFLFRASPFADSSGQIIKWCGMNTDIDDRKRAEEAARAHERLFRLVFDGLPALVTLMKPDGGIELANRHVLEYFRATLEELQAREDGSTFHPDDWPAVLATWGKSMETGDACDFEARNRGGDGAYRWFRIRGFPCAEGRIERWYFLQTDIDDAKRAEALLAGEKRLLEMVAGGHSMSGILEALCRLVENCAAGCHCSVVLVDRTGTRLEHGVAPSLPASFIDAINGRPVDVDSGPCAMAAFLKQQVVSADISTEARWAAAAWRPMAIAHGLRAVWATPISSKTGKVLGAFAIYFDEPTTPTPFHQKLIAQFTNIASVAIEHAQNDAALKRSEAFLSEAQRLSSTGGFSWSLSSDELMWSEEVYSIFEVDPTVPATLELTLTRLHPDDVAGFHEMRIRQLRDGSDFEHDYRLLMPDQRVKYLHVVAHATHDEDGHVAYNAAVQDVTERRLAEEVLNKVRSELAHMARVTSLGALTASIAHEVNQPLSGIITNASTCLRMLAADPPNVDGARETARRTIRDGNRAADVITRLRALFAKKPPSIESVDLNEATREVIALSLSELQRSGVIARVELADDLPMVCGDRVQLQQVILNLLLNATDAMKEIVDRPRQVLIKTERDDGDRVRLTVQDAGLGFGPQGVEKVFEAFYTTKNNGMGMGLAVSRSIVESHQGRLWAAENEGPGATFAFSIPREPDSGKAIRTSRAPGSVA